MIKIWPGDFFSTKGKGITGWGNEHLTCTPRWNHTKRFHFGVIDNPVFDKEGRFEDFRTCESIRKGPSELRFFARYIGQDIELYRIWGITEEEGVRLANSISTIGDKGYGFRDFLDAGLDVGKLLLTGYLPPYFPEEFTFSRNDAYICTEIPAFGAAAIGKPIEPPGHLDLWDIPVLYLQAEEEHRIVRYYKGDLKDLWVAMKEIYGRPG